jgi:hypothetical protein
VLRALILFAALLAQAAAPADLKEAVWDAVHPALPFPAATEQNEPVDGSATARWLVRKAQADEEALVAEVVANPLNRDTQERATQDMAAIQKEVVAAERRAQVEFERALDNTRASGQATTIRGITLDDEGIAGERADAESAMTIEVPSARDVTIDAVDAPTLKESAAGAPWIVRVPARVVEKASGGRATAHYYPAEAVIYLASTKPTITEAPRHVFNLRATPANPGSVPVVIVLRGNGELIDAVIAKSNWSRLGGSKDLPLPEY